MQPITEDAITAADLWGGQIPRGNLEEALSDAQPHILGPELADLRERLIAANNTLMADSKNPVNNGTEMARLRNKADGVRLALSYVDEIVRSL